MVAPLDPEGETLAFPPRVSLCGVPAPRRSLAGARHDGGAGVGRQFLGRIHAVGRSAPSRDRARLDVDDSA